MLREITIKSVLNKKKSRDSWFLDDYTLNPYEGCSFNCQYCYVRGSKYGLNMAENLSVKINGPQVLDKQLALRARKGQYGMIALASATDPYIGHEEKYGITRRFLERILHHRFPVMIITKSHLVLRDIDLLRQIDKQAIHAADLDQRLRRGAIVSFSFSTLDERIARTLEPGAPSPSIRLETMKKCKEAGLFVGMNCIPLLPFISDTNEEIEKLVSAAKIYGADYVLIGGLTLFGEGPADSKTLYRHFLARNFPELVDRYSEVFLRSTYPPSSYLRDLDRRAEKICSYHGMARRIIPLEQ